MNVMTFKNYMHVREVKLNFEWEKNTSFMHLPYFEVPSSIWSSWVVSVDTITISWRTSIHISTSKKILPRKGGKRWSLKKEFTYSCLFHFGMCEPLFLISNGAIESHMQRSRVESGSEENVKYPGCYIRRSRSYYFVTM